MNISYEDLRAKIQELAGTRFTKPQIAEIAANIGSIIDGVPKDNDRAEQHVLKNLGHILDGTKASTIATSTREAAYGKMPYLNPLSGRPVPPIPPPRRDNDVDVDVDEEKPLPVHQIDVASELIDKATWDAVEKSASAFDPISKPGACRQTCQHGTPDPLSPSKTPVPIDDLQPTYSVCGRIRAWGVYWMCKLVEKGLMPPDSLGAKDWHAALEKTAEDFKTAETLQKAYNIQPKKIGGKTYTAEEMAESWRSNMLIVAALERDCRNGGSSMVGVVDSSGVLQAAAEYIVMDFKNPPYLFVADLATAPWNITGDDGCASGAGKALIETLAVESSGTGCGGRIELVPLNGMAKDFYEHLRFTDGGNTLLPEHARILIQERDARRSLIGK